MNQKHELLHAALTGPILGAFYTVHRDLGHGFLESVYEGAMLVALRALGLAIERQKRIIVRYRTEIVGDFNADLVVENKIIIELKVARALDPVHDAQVLNYLRATEYEVGFLLHFAPKARFRRFLLTNDQKPQTMISGPRWPSVVNGPSSSQPSGYNDAK